MNKWQALAYSLTFRVPGSTLLCSILIVTHPGQNVFCSYKLPFTISFSLQSYSDAGYHKSVCNCTSQLCLGLQDFHYQKVLWLSCRGKTYTTKFQSPLTDIEGLASHSYPRTPCVLSALLTSNKLQMESYFKTTSLPYARNPDMKQCGPEPSVKTTFQVVHHVHAIVRSTLLIFLKPLHTHILIQWLFNQYTPNDFLQYDAYQHLQVRTFSSEIKEIVVSDKAFIMSKSKACITCRAHHNNCDQDKPAGLKAWSTTSCINHAPFCY